MKIFLKRFVFILFISFISVSCSFLNWNSLFNRSVFSSENDNPDSTESRKTPIYEKFYCIPDKENIEIGWVTYVIDGDSIKALIEGQEFEIRYIGIDAPEIHGPENSQAKAASIENEKLVSGKKVFLFRDVSNTDKFDRLLRYVFTEEYFVNYELVKRGFARSKSYIPDVSCQQIFNQAAE